MQAGRQAWQAVGGIVVIKLGAAGRAHDVAIVGVGCVGRVV